MVERRNPISVMEAVMRVMKFAKEGKKEEVSIYECNGRFLCEDIVANHDVPSFDRSAYDGFAIRSVDLKGASKEKPITLSVIDEIGAGQVCQKRIGEYEAVRIMTGAMLPSDCDAVVMFEVVKEGREYDQPYIIIDHEVEKGTNLSFQGEDVKKGKVLVEKGTKINPGIMALLATFGYEKVPVAKKPIIGIFATGTELLEVDEPLEKGKIRNSNAYMIMAQIERAGAIPVYFGKLQDVFTVSYEAMKEKLESVDILITTGGVSVGDYDLLPAIYKELGAEVLFNKVAMRPGSVTTVAHLDGKLLYGLSGNPSACYVGFEIFTKPIIRRYLFSSKPHLQSAPAILEEDFLTANAFTRFFRSTVSWKEDGLHTVPSGVDKSNIVTSLAFANALTILPSNSTGYQKGERVNVLLLEEEEGSEWPWN
ncbi:gephyrin-like molybdotransferase Glp [Niallia circulans]|uniref:molybdopterin molybdotransferase MoeA n=1 Tax=Niallia circulans TaxID=1397 RepID=UPI001F28F08C|nr:gephyrin-like molybdotransferase Glp [Niallia circulans]MCF2648661.1 molybdopterin molybdotransferase MoeA [Niallia circulans]